MNILTPDEVVSLYKKHGLKARRNTTNNMDGGCCVLGLLYYDKTGNYCSDYITAAQAVGYSHRVSFGFDDCHVEYSPADENEKWGRAVGLACKEAGILV